MHRGLEPALQGSFASLCLFYRNSTRGVRVYGVWSVVDYVSDLKINYVFLKITSDIKRGFFGPH